jgi:hypothetical protein
MVWVKKIWVKGVGVKEIWVKGVGDVPPPGLGPEIFVLCTS